MEEKATSPKKRRRFYKRWWFRIAAVAVVASAVCIGPWPVSSSRYEGTEYAAATFARIDALPKACADGPLSAGVGVVDITPPVGEPLAGYSGRSPKASDSVLDRLHAKALTLSSGQTTVTIVGGDLLLVLPDLRDAILQRAQLPREEVYFTATHTHSGGGGYGPHWIEQLVTGKYDPAILNRLADAFAEAIRLSRADLQPAELVAGRHGELSAVSGERAGDSNAPPFVRNRLDANRPAYDTVWALAVRPRGRAEANAIAVLAVASPHPTVYRARNHKVSGDYPAAVQENIEAKYGGVCLFAIGAVGSMGPAQEELPPPERSRKLAGIIAGRVEARLSHATGPQTAAGAQAGGRMAESPWRPTARLGSAIVEVDLPVLQCRISQGWRLSPVVSPVIHSRRTYVHAVRINDLVLVGMPADFSGELAAPLEEWARGRGLSAVVTSFNGDYMGYLLPAERYSHGDYEGLMSFFGEGCGEYFGEIARRIIDVWAGAGSDAAPRGQRPSGSPAGSTAATAAAE